MVMPLNWQQMPQMHVPQMQAPQPMQPWGPQQWGHPSQWQPMPYQYPGPPDQSSDSEDNGTLTDQYSNVSSDSEEDQAKPANTTTTCDTALADFWELFVVKSTTGGVVLEQLAASVNRGFRNPMSAENIKTMSDRYMLPDNCDGLTVPRLNEEVYAAPSNREAARKDKGIQRTQRVLSTATVPLLQIMEAIVAQAKGETDKTLPPEQLLARAGDAIKLISTAFSQLTDKRREMIRPSLPEEYGKVCALSNLVTDQLLGTDLDH